MESVLGYIAKGKEEGAPLPVAAAASDRRRIRQRRFVAPTVFTDCTDDMTIVREEIFGPVMSILTFETEEEVIRAPTTPTSAWPPASSPRTCPRATA